VGSLGSDGLRNLTRCQGPMACCCVRSAGGYVVSAACAGRTLKVTLFSLHVARQRGTASD
jgi:hypothetical protein